MRIKGIRAERVKRGGVKNGRGCEKIPTQQHRHHKTRNIQKQETTQT
jgi:hypothetical protein